MTEEQQEKPDEFAAVKQALRDNGLLLETCGLGVFGNDFWTWNFAEKTCARLCPTGDSLAFGTALLAAGLSKRDIQKAKSHFFDKPKEKEIKQKEAEEKAQAKAQAREEKQEEQTIPAEYAAIYEDSLNSMVYVRFYDVLEGKAFFYGRNYNEPFDFTTIDRFDCIQLPEKIVYPIPVSRTSNPNRPDLLSNVPTSLADFDSLDSLCNDWGKAFKMVWSLPKDQLDAAKLYQAWALFWPKAAFIPMLRNVAPLGQSKSRGLQAMFYTSPNAVLVADPTAAGVKRVARQYKTLLLIDEADEKDSDESNELIKIYNCIFF